MAEKLIGRVVRTRFNDQGERVFGFITTDDKREFFFHAGDMTTKRMPRDNSYVRFMPLPQTAEGKMDRAIEIDIVSEPIPVPAPEIDSSRHT